MLGSNIVKTTAAKEKEGKPKHAVAVGRSFIDEIGVTKAELGNKEAADSFTGEIGVTKAEVGKKEAAGSFTGEIDATKAEVGNKEAASTIVETAAAAAKADDKGKAAEPTVAMITKERVPDSFIDRIKRHPSRKLPPLSQEEIELYSEFFPEEPEAIALELDNIIRWNYFVDLEQDCLRQYTEKGYAEVGVDFTNGTKQIFILPQPQHQPQVMMMTQQGNGGGGRSKTMLVFSGFAMIVSALVVLLLSCLL